MPIVTICGAPTKAGLDYLGRVRDRVISVVLEVTELKLNDSSEVSVFFPVDRLAADGKELIVYVDGFYKKPERTIEVQNKLAEVIGTVVEKMFTSDDVPPLVECFIIPFDPETQGFWTSEA